MMPAAPTHTAGVGGPKEGKKCYLHRRRSRRRRMVDVARRRDAPRITVRAARPGRFVYGALQSGARRGLASARADGAARGGLAVGADALLRIAVLGRRAGCGGCRIGRLREGAVAGGSATRRSSDESEEAKDTKRLHDGRGPRAVRGPRTSPVFRGLVMNGGRHWQRVAREPGFTLSEHATRAEASRCPRFFSTPHRTRRGLDGIALRRWP